MRRYWELTALLTGFFVTTAQALPPLDGNGVPALFGYAGAACYDDNSGSTVVMPTYPECDTRLQEVIALNVQQFGKTVTDVTFCAPRPFLVTGWCSSYTDGFSTVRVSTNMPVTVAEILLLHTQLREQYDIDAYEQAVRDTFAPRD